MYLTVCVTYASEGTGEDENDSGCGVWLGDKVYGNNA